MEVYAVQVSDGWNYWNHSFYSTLDKAEWAALLFCGDVIRLNIDPNFNLPERKLYWQGEITSDNIVINKIEPSIREKEYPLIEEPDIQTLFSRGRYLGNDLIYLNFWAEDEIAARKICEEKRTEMKAAGTWPRKNVRYY